MCKTIANNVNSSSQFTSFSINDVNKSDLSILNVSENMKVRSVRTVTSVSVRSNSNWKLNIHDHGCLKTIAMIRSRDTPGHVFKQSLNKQHSIDLNFRFWRSTGFW